MAQRLKCLLVMWETRVQFLGQEDPLEKEMATHSSILAWRIQWTEEPGRLLSTGSQRVGHDWVTSLHFTSLHFNALYALLWFSHWLSSKEFTCNAGDTRDVGSVPGLGRSPGKGNNNGFQYFCLGNPMNRQAWWGTVHGVAKELDTT